MAWGLLLMGLVLVVGQAVVNQVRPSGRSESSFGALSAAEAGLADISARMQVGSISAVLGDATNLAFRQWVPVPGDPSGSEFTYAIDASRSGAVGELRAFATGRVNGVTRTLEATLSKRSTLDYVYMSDIETPSPDLPGAYSTSVIAGGGGRTSQEVARTLCARRWYEGGPSDYNRTTGAFVTGNQRNLKFCQWAGIFSSERLVGRVHTNDVWRLENTNLTSAIGRGHDHVVLPGDRRRGPARERSGLLRQPPLHRHLVLGRPDLVAVGPDHGVAGRRLPPEQLGRQHAAQPLLRRGPGPAAEPRPAEAAGQRDGLRVHRPDAHPLLGGGRPGLHVRHEPGHEAHGRRVRRR